MRKLPVKIDRRPLHVVRDDEVEVVAPPSTPFVSFRYAFTELSIHDGKARVRARKTQLEDGKLTSESFEGELDRSSYERAVVESQRYFATQAAIMLDALSSFLPFRPKRERR